MDADELIRKELNHHYKKSLEFHFRGGRQNQ